MKCPICGVCGGGHMAHCAQGPGHELKAGTWEHAVAKLSERVDALESRVTYLDDPDFQVKEEDTLSCGHPSGCLVTKLDGDHCGWCADIGALRDNTQEMMRLNSRLNGKEDVKPVECVVCYRTNVTVSRVPFAVWMDASKIRPLICADCVGLIKTDRSLAIV